MKNFWLKLDKPFFCLAPMADVTDCAFRKLITKYGKPDVLWTEFVAADGLAHPVAREKLLIDLKFEEGEHPIVAQIFGSKPENIREAANLCRELGFDGIDINMGCPDRTIEKQGAGAATMKNPELAKEIIRAAKEGAGDLPVSIKTRIGYNKVEIETWLPVLLNEDIAALTVHLRTRKEMSDVPAHWELMPEIVALRDKINPNIILIGNGDVLDLDDAKKKCEETGCDGAMLGRAIFGNPWLFKNLSQYAPSLQEKLTVMAEHTKLFESMLGGVKNFAIMKKHYKAYVNGFDGAKELRMELMDAKNADEVEKTVTNFLKNGNHLQN
ncbi:MAG: tRNA-dihydrouridine synthase [Candidatus Pacebacteria bacterium]|nr:tRNA-dihydrouridine synthase [Candidatus Paceibacterota bacterium]MBP9851290.1 tRNA-dihydrouridine synthase [Candidatus Paceibacterota bacterium]